MIQFRLAQASDLKQIAVIKASAFPVDLTKTQSEMAGHLVAYPETFLVAASGGTVLGYIFGPSGSQRYLTDQVLDDYPNNPADHFQWVLSLTVAEKYRRQGIGSKLLALFAARAKKLGRKGV
jgi:ribosomal protein S18 acetylase RimI-like enzyme